MKSKVVYSWQNLNKLHAVILLGVPVVSCILLRLWWSQFKVQSFWLALAMYAMSGLGITAGYHRLWSHRAYQAATPVRLMLALWGAASVQGSILWWCKGHRFHHRYTDTFRDPYNALNGAFFSHIGWMLFDQGALKDGAERISIRDLQGDWIARWQHKIYLPLAVICSFIFPALIAHVLFDDWKGGLAVAGFTRLVFLHHSTFCINSLAHIWGSQTYDDKLTPKDSIICAILTFGEGHHNFHHQFPNDHRNGIRWFHYDPTKWFIRALYYVGLAWSLKEFSPNVIEMGEVNMLQKSIDQRKRGVIWPTDPDLLPTMSIDEVRNLSQKGERLVIAFNCVHDVSDFIESHPGGAALIRASIGKDVTDAFTGGVYDHSMAATNLLAGFRVAKLPAEHIAEA